MDPCVLANHLPANQRGLDTQRKWWLFVREILGALSHAVPFLRSSSLAASRLSVLAQSSLSKRRLGAALLLRVGRVLAAALGSGRPRLLGCRKAGQG